MGNANDVVDSTKTNESMGREQKAQDGASQSGTGKGMAIASGSSMMATAIPMLASIDPLTRATGAQLMSMAGLEFAQAAADGGTEKGNKAQEDLLRADGNQNMDQVKAAQEQGKKEVQNQVANALAGNSDLQKMLGQNGVNGDDFAKRFAAGEMLSPESILAASGAGAGVSSEMLSQAAKEPLGNQVTLQAIQEDSDRDNAKSDSGASGGGSSFANGGQKSDGSFGDPRGAGASGEKTGPDGLVDSLSKAGASALAGLANATDGELKSMLAGLVGMGGQTGKAADAAAMKLNQEALAKKGILKATGKPGIFMLARRNYRSFQKWRRKIQVAAR